MSQAVVDVLVRVSQLIDNVKARNAFVIAPGVNGVFKSGKDPLNNNSPFIEEPEAIELMNEIMSGIEVILSRRKYIFDKLGSKIDSDVDIKQFVTGYINNPNDQAHLKRILVSEEIIFKLSAFQQSNRMSLRSKYCFENAAVDDFTWGFEAACEVISAQLAMQRVAIEVLRRAMTRGCVYQLTVENFGIKGEMTITKDYDHNIIAAEVSKFNDRVDKRIASFFNEAKVFWNNRHGQIRKLTAINLGDSPPTAVSHDGDLYWLSAKGELQKFVNSTHQEVSINVLHMCSLVSHKGKLYSVSKLGGLYELDLDSGKATFVIEQLLFKNCASMVSLGDYIYITRSTYFYNFYKVDPTNKIYRCLGNDWNGARLAVDTNLLYARCNGYVFDSIYSIHDLSIGMPSYRLKSHEWSMARVPNIVSHGDFLYTQGSDGDLFLVDYEFDTLNITQKHKRHPSTQVTPLASHGMSLVCQHFNDWRFLPHKERRCYMAIVRPAWTQHPKNWFEKLLSVTSIH